MGIPDRWLPYSPLGKLIAGTRFVAFKVPLSEGLNRNLPEEQRFSPAQLMELCPKLSVVVDLTNTKRYYNRNEFTSNSIAHEKIFCPGRQIPPEPLTKRFNAIVDTFLSSNKETDGVIGVHCTHGVNRTGYFICRYMIERMGMTFDSAVKAFQEARGHHIERNTYVNHLRTLSTGGRQPPPGPSSDNTEGFTVVSYKNRGGEKRNHYGEYEREVETRRQTLNRENNRKPDWKHFNRTYDTNKASDPCTNSGVDYGYDLPMPSRYGSSNRGRYGFQRDNAGKYQNRRSYDEDKGDRNKVRNRTWVNSAYKTQTSSRGSSSTRHNNAPQTAQSKHKGKEGGT